MISDNNHITWSVEDIRRYWNGQLSAQEMHAMEKAALDDPFLADAIEGYGEALKEKGEIEVIGQLNKLHEEMAKQPASDKRRAPVAGFRWWKLAAAAIVVIAAGLWIFTSNNENKQREIATVQDTRKQEPAPPATSDNNKNFGDTESKEAPVAENKATDSMTYSGNASTARRSNERGLESFESKELHGYLDSVAAYRSKSNALKERTILANRWSRGDTQTSDDRLSRTPSVASSSAPLSIKDTAEPKREMEVVVFSDGYKNLSEKKPAATDKAGKEKFQNFITGVVTDNKNNPLANAYLQVNNFNNQYTTDLRGQFRIPVEDTIVKVSVTVPGFANAQFQLKSSYDGTGYATDNKLQLQPQTANASPQGALSGVDQKLARKKDAPAKSVLNEDEYIRTVTTQDAQPVYGWVGFEQYLEENKRRPTENPHLVGEVAVSFTVDKKQQLSDFKVEKSLSPQHDAEALRLIKEGPSWKLRKGRKARVTVVVRF